jgi:hypothetical protein
VSCLGAKCKIWSSSVPKLLFPTPLQGEPEEEFSKSQKFLKSQALILCWIHEENKNSITLNPNNEIKQILLALQLRQQAEPQRFSCAQNWFALDFYPL